MPTLGERNYAEEQKIETERKRKEEADRKAQEEADRRAREEAELREKEEANKRELEKIYESFKQFVERSDEAFRNSET